MTVQGDLGEGGGAAVGAVPRFAVFATLSDGSRLALRHFLPFVGLSILVAVPVFMLGFLLVLAMPGGEFSIGLAGEGASVNGVLGVIYLGVMALVAMSAYLVLNAAMVLRFAQALRGARLGVMACLGQALNALPRLLGLGGILVVVFGVLLMGPLYAVFSAFSLEDSLDPALAFGIAGLSFLAYLALAVLWWLAVPALAIEGAGPFACLARSRMLTKGRRWSVFAVILLMMIAQGASQALLEAVFGEESIAGGLVGLAISLFLTATGIALTAVGYVRLRAEKEGPADLAQVFD